MTKYTQQEKNEAIEILRNCGVNDLTTIWANLMSVSSTGMRRNLRFYVVQDGTILNITWSIAALSGNRFNNKGNLVISSCGMDMAFASIYNIGNIDELADFRDLAQNHRKL